MPKLNNEEAEKPALGDDMVDDGHDGEARKIAYQAKSQVEAHERVCAVRYAAIDFKLKLILTVLAVGPTLAGALIGFLANRAFPING